MEFAPTAQQVLMTPTNVDNFVGDYMKPKQVASYGPLESTLEELLFWFHCGDVTRLFAHTGTHLLSAIDLAGCPICRAAVQSQGCYFLGLLARLKIAENRLSRAGAAHWLVRNDTLECALVNVAPHSQSAVRPLRRFSDWRDTCCVDERVCNRHGSFR
jgi:hypothetical protein